MGYTLLPSCFCLCTACMTVNVSISAQQKIEVVEAEHTDVPSKEATETQLFLTSKSNNKETIF